MEHGKTTMGTRRKERRRKEKRGEGKKKRA
jgi:hypothetical protein